MLTGWLPLAILVLLYVGSIVGLLAVYGHQGKRPSRVVKLGLALSAAAMLYLVVAAIFQS